MQRSHDPSLDAPPTGQSPTPPSSRPHSSIRPSRRRSTFAARAVGITVALVGVTTFLPSPAQAATYASVMNTAGAYRYCVDTSLSGCASRGTVPAGRKVRMHCYAQGTWATGTYGSDRYFYVTTETGTRGFVHSSRVDDQTTVGKCSAHAGVAPARWAAEHIDLKKPTTAEKRGQSLTWWSGWCLLFAQDAFIFTNGSPDTGLGTALAAFRYYRDNKGVAHTDMGAGSIAIGSMVFWGTSTGSAGHVGIYVGNGDVVSTTGAEGETKPVAIRSLSGAIGWVHPSDV